ncbi:MAG: hypothetical protein WBC51_22670 [Vicinamibacterales bacterium]
MMIAVSIWLLLACGLLLSVLAFALNARGVSLGRSAFVVLAFCLAFGLFQGFSLKTVSIRLSIAMWFGFVFLPALAVFAISRISALRANAWLLLLVGPLAYFVAMIVAMTVVNVIASGSAR